MPDGFDIVYPPKGRTTFDGGKNSKFERSIIADNESPDCLNVVFTNGAAATRGGSAKLNTAAIGSFAGDGLYVRHDSTGSETMVAFAGGTAWGLAGTSFTTIGSGQSVFTAGVRVGAAEYENHLFIGNGYVTPYKWNGAHFTRHGVPAPASALTGAVSATGGTFPAATFFYKVTYVNSQTVQGDVCAISTAFVVGANGSVELSGIPVAPVSHGVNARRLYRASGVSTTFGLISTINDNTTTTFSDTYYPATTTAPTDQGEPPKYNSIVAHKGRLFCNDVSNPNFVWYSEIFEPYTFKATSFQPVGDASFDLVKGVYVYGDSLLILGAQNCYLWFMPTTDPTDWQLIKIKSAFGCKSPYGVFSFNNEVMIPAMQSGKLVGFAAVNGATIDVEATNLDHGRAGSLLKSDRIETDEIFDIQEAYVGNISAQVFNNKAYISVPYGANQTTNNRVQIFDFSVSNLAKKQRDSWAPLKGINAAQFAVYNGLLYYIDSTATGFVRQLESTTYSDDSSAIDSYFWTKEFSGQKGHENLQKDFRKLKILVELSGSFYMTVNWRVDSDTGIGSSKQISLNAGTTTWGTLIWGVSRWGGGTAQKEFTIPLGQATGKRIQFRFSNQNTAAQNFKIHGLNFTYNVKGTR